MQQIGLDIVVSLDLSRGCCAPWPMPVITPDRSQPIAPFILQAQTDTFTLIALLDGSDRIQMQITQPRKEG